MTKFPDDRLRHHTEKFLSYTLSQGRKYHDWEAAWRYWILMAVERTWHDAKPTDPNAVTTF